MRWLSQWFVPAFGLHPSTRLVSLVDMAFVKKMVASHSWASSIFTKHCINIQLMFVDKAYEMHWNHEKYVVTHWNEWQYQHHIPTLLHILLDTLVLCTISRALPLSTNLSCNNPVLIVLDVRHFFIRGWIRNMQQYSAMKKQTVLGVQITLHQPEWEFIHVDARKYGTLQGINPQAFRVTRSCARVESCSRDNIQILWSTRQLPTTVEHVTSLKECVTACMEVPAPTGSCNHTRWLRKRIWFSVACNIRLLSS